MPRDAVTKFLSGCLLCQRSSTPFSSTFVNDFPDNFFGNSKNDSSIQSNESNVNELHLTNIETETFTEQKNDKFMPVTSDITKIKLLSTSDEIYSNIWQFLADNQTFLNYYQLWLAAQKKTLTLAERNCQTKLNFDEELSNNNNTCQLKLAEKNKKSPVLNKMKVKQIKSIDEQIENGKYTSNNVKPTVNVLQNEDTNVSTN